MDKQSETCLIIDSKPTLFSREDKYDEKMHKD